MYEKFITQLCMYTKVIRILAKGYLSTSLISPLKLQEIFKVVTEAFWTTNPDYNIAMKRLHLYYDIK